MLLAICLWVCAALPTAFLGAPEQGPPGISVKVTPKGLEYLAHITSKVLPLVFKGIEFDDPLDQELSFGYRLAVANLSITDMDNPTVVARYQKSRGIIADGYVATARVKADYDFAATAGQLHAQLQDFNISVTLGLREINDGQPQLILHDCDIKIGGSEIQTGSWALQQAISWFGDEWLRDFVSGKICEVFSDAVSYEGSGSGESILCAKDELQKSNVGRRAPLPMEAFTVNMSLTNDPQFHEDYADVGFNGTVLYKDRLSRIRYVLLPPQSFKPIGPKMMRIAVSSMVANSFFSHVFAYSLGNMHTKTTMDRLPSSIRTVMKFFCHSCTVHFVAGLSRPPVMLIRNGRSALRINVFCWVRAFVNAYGKRVDLFWADTLVRSRAYPYVDRNTNRLHARTQVERIYVNTNPRSGILGKIFGIVLRDATSQISEYVPLQLSGPVNTALRKIFGPQGGIPLPYVCGIRLGKSTLFPINNAVIVDTDMSYNYMPLVRRLRKELAKKKQ